MERRPESACELEHGDPCGRVLRTIHLNQRLVSLAVRSVTLAGAMSGGAGRVWIFLEAWLGGLVPTMFTWCMRNLIGVRHSVVSIDVGTESAAVEAWPRTCRWCTG